MQTVVLVHDHIFLSFEWFKLAKFDGHYLGNADNQVWYGSVHSWLNKPWQCISKEYFLLIHISPVCYTFWVFVGGWCKANWFEKDCFFFFDKIKCVSKSIIFIHSLSGTEIKMEAALASREEDRWTQSDIFWNIWWKYLIWLNGLFDDEGELKVSPEAKPLN